MPLRRLADAVRRRSVWIVSGVLVSLAAAVGGAVVVDAGSAPSAKDATHATCTKWDIAGPWNATQSNPAGARVSLTFTQSGDRLSGTASYSSLTGTISGSLKGSHLDFTVSWNNGIQGQYSGTVTAKSISGTAFQVSDPSLTATWTAAGKARCLGEGTISGVVTSTDCSATACLKKGLPGVSVRAGSKTDTTDSNGRYSLELPDGSYSVKATLAGTNFAPDSASVDLKGSNVSGVDFGTCGSSSQKSVRQPAAVGRASKGPFCRLFMVDLKPTPTTDAALEKVPVKFGYEGQGWDPKGGPIVVSWDGKVTKTFPAAEKFGWKIYATNWPRRDLKRCWGVVSAAQAGVTKSVTLSRDRAGVVIFADNDKVLRSGDIVCAGEQFVLDNTSGTVIITIDGKIFYLYQAGGAPVDSFSAPSSCWRLVPSSRGHVTVTRLANGGVQTQPAAGPCP